MNGTGTAGMASNCWHLQKKFTVGIAAMAVLFMSLLFSAKIVGIDLGAPSKQCCIPLNSGPYFSTFWTLFIGTSTLIVFGK